jgi:hypothetical protein
MMPVLGGTIQELQSAKLAIAKENTPAALAELVTQGAPRGSKLKISIEKKIENIWLESQELGWSYNDFVSHLLEVLVVLNHRSVLPILNSNTKNSEKAKASSRSAERISCSSFDRLRMRPSDFNGLDLMVSLSNHGPHRFQRPAREAGILPK